MVLVNTDQGRGKTFSWESKVNLTQLAPIPPSSDCSLILQWEFASKQKKNVEFSMQQIPNVTAGGESRWRD